MYDIKKESLYTTACGHSVIVQRKKGIKRLSMRFSLKSKALMVSAPIRLPSIDITDFIESAREWIAKVVSIQSSTITTSKALSPGQIIQLLGNTVTIEFMQNCQEKVILNGNRLDVYCIRSRFERLVVQYLKDLAHAKLCEYSYQYAKQLGVSITKITVKEMTTRFGSCTASGNLNYCWRVVFSPEPVLAYLCAHEVSHLKEMNHSKAFWAYVEYLCPNYLQHRKWLKQRGKELFIIV